VFNIHLENKCRQVVSALAIVVGALYSLGDYGKLLNNIYVGSVMGVGFVMALVGSISFEETRAKKKGSSSRTFRFLNVTLFLLFGVTAYLIYYENSTDDVQISSRTGWVSLDQETRRDIQSEHMCCGWNDERDNVALPCRTVAGGCKDFIVDDLTFRVDVLRSILRLQIASQLFALIFGCLMTKSLSEKQRRENRSSSSSHDEEEALLRKSSSRLRESFEEGVFKEN